LPQTAQGGQPQRSPELTADGRRWTQMFLWRRSGCAVASLWRDKGEVEW
jgi:hypothetical protein